MGNTFRRVLERYLEARSRELERQTIAHYRTHVNGLIEFLSVRYPEIDSPAQLERSPHIEGWLRKLKNRKPPYTDGTRDQAIRHVRTFLRGIRAWDWPESAARGLIRPEDFPNRRPREPWKILFDTFPDSNDVFHKDLKRYLEIRGSTLRLSTLRHYREAILRVITFLQTNFPKIDSFAKLERRHIEGWLQMLAKREPPYTNGSRRQSIGCVRRFFEDVQQWGWLRCPPAELIFPGDFPPPQQYLPKPLPPEIDVALMARLEKQGDIRSLGLVVARRTGLRIGDLSRLEVDCLTESPDGRFSLRVPLGKLHSEREIPVDDRTADLIKTIRAERGEPPTTTDPDTGRLVALLICNLKGRAIDPSLFRVRLKQVASECGIDQNVYPHRLRHTYATEMLRHGVSLPGVMKLLGHRTLKMTLRYVEITNVDLGRDYLRAIESAGRHYASMDACGVKKIAAGSDSLESIEATFDQLVARVQAVRFDQPDPERRRRLQRFVERLRRAQQDLPDLIRRDGRNLRGDCPVKQSRAGLASNSLGDVPVDP